MPTGVRVVRTDDPEREVSGMNSRMRNERTGETRECAFSWCVTEHGSTVHPDDEDHRSVGFGMTARVRQVTAHGPGILAGVEVGLVRRTDDTETWVVVETGVGISVSVPLRAARALIAGVQSDDLMAEVLIPERDID
ncbi:hypothetical protein [uncultured Microbacterium sp.]|uniref:hypothetical protein n=1 Tax=uncultured Microbacterium sp. TaxID=191216 RepID=UPI0025F61D07|nr:hypothetical protein [uncultured Microbacterium sp.]